MTEQGNCQQTVDECKCTVHKLLGYIRTLTVCVCDMLGVDCESVLGCDGPAPRGRVPVPPVTQECAAPCDAAKKRCQNQPCPSTCDKATGYFNQKRLPEQRAGPCPPGGPTEVVDVSRARTDCVFFCCRGPEPATNRCVYRRLPPAPVPKPRPLPECCPCLQCKTLAEPGKNRFPLRKGLCEYQWPPGDGRPCCDKPAGAACECVAKRTLYRDQLVERCVDRLTDIVNAITAMAEWRARACADRGECPITVVTTTAAATGKAVKCETKVTCNLRKALCPKKPLFKRR